MKKEFKKPEVALRYARQHNTEVKREHREATYYNGAKYREYYYVVEV